MGRENAPKRMPPFTLNKRRCQPPHKANSTINLVDIFVTYPYCRVQYLHYYRTKFNNKHTMSTPTASQKKLIAERQPYLILKAYLAVSETKQKNLKLCMLMH